MPNFISVVDSILEMVEPLADGKTLVPLGAHIRHFTLRVISKVRMWTCVCVCVCVRACVCVYQAVTGRPLYIITRQS